MVTHDLLSIKHMDTVPGLAIILVTPWLLDNLALFLDNLLKAMKTRRLWNSFRLNMSYFIAWHLFLDLL